MREDKYLVAFFLILTAVLLLQLPEAISLFPALAIIDPLLIAALALTGLLIGLYGQYLNPIKRSGSILVSIGLIIITFFLLPWWYYLFFASLGIIPYIIGFYIQKTESERIEAESKNLEE
ncbi:MAG: hypothetical protein BV458_09455 [Thermoplasmata archaeon M9B2D]|nr:MAG: hypothetical protein BV458_09455 [Thermoplasmata archaeon M9B2D]